MKETRGIKNGYFEISRETSDLSFAEFNQKYFDTETPVIIEGIGSDWVAKDRWNEEYIREKLSHEPSASAASLWYWMNRDVLGDEYNTPDIVNSCLDSSNVFPRTQTMRVWLHQEGSVSNWHYDGGMVNVFNAQVKGRKEWLLVSPHTPLDCYPFTSYAIIDGKEEETLHHKIHTRFILNEGDMVFIPHLWFHKVISLDKENINLNWIFTKKQTNISSKSLKRDLERYLIHSYFVKHRFTFVRTLFHKLNALLPGYLKINWRYQEMIKTPYETKPSDLLKRVFKELVLWGKVALHANKIKPYMKTLKSVPKLEKRRT